MDRTQIIDRAMNLIEAVAGYAERARWFFYEVALSKHVCPGCGGRLEMVRESRCRCRVCRDDFDPTVAFQRCPACGDRPRLRIRRYECSSCGADVASRFMFDGLVFDTDYFRQKMAEHRARSREQRERVQQMLADSRSGTLQLPSIDLGAIPGLSEALNGLTEGCEGPLPWSPRSGFDLMRYQSHVQAHIGPIAITLDEVPPLSEEGRLDRIWRFVAIIFLAHAGLVETWQDGPDVMVKRSETHAKGQDVSGNVEELDGVEGPLGRAEA